MQLILGSGSPRRAEILGYFLIPFRQIASDFDEDSVAFQGNPSAYVELLSKKKGKMLALRYKEELIITADTTVFFEGEIFNKPRDEEEAFSMLRRLSGNSHEVVTGVTVTCGEKQESAVAKTVVTITKLVDAQVRAYQKRCHAQDKAAGYAIQREGSLIVERIEGCYYNVMGLPVQKLHELLLKWGVDLWDAFL